MIDFGEGAELGPLDRIAPSTLRTWRNDFQIWKWCRQNDLISEANQLHWCNGLKDRSDVKMYSIVSSTGQDVGVCGLTSIDHVNRRAEFSLYIAPGFQQQGHARAGLKTLISHGFSNLGLNHIWGETFDGNPAAFLFESIGFIKEGTRRGFYFRSGKFIDCHLYSILASEWTANEKYKKEQL